MGWLILAIFLYVLCAALIVAEVFVPSYGMVSVCALLCLIGGLFLFFRHSPTAGWIGVGSAVVIIPAVIVFAYKIFPHTAFGKSMTLEPPVRPQGDAIPDSSELRELIGKKGVSVTDLRPVGICNIEGKRVECVAESEMIEKDAEIIVIDIESTQVTVRKNEV